MEYWVYWLIAAAIGLVVGLIVHGIVRFALGPSLIITLLMGVIGALLGAYFLTPVVEISTTSTLTNFYIWAVIGGVVLSLITELLFAGERRGRVVIA